MDLTTGILLVEMGTLIRPNDEEGSEVKVVSDWHPHPLSETLQPVIAPRRAGITEPRKNLHTHNILLI